MATLARRPGGSGGGSSGPVTAANVTVADAEDHYTGDSVEEILDELGDALAAGEAFYDSVVGAGGVAEFDVTNIPATGKTIRWMISGRAEAAVANRDIRMQFNGDTANNYAYQRQFSHSGNNNSGATSTGTLGVFIGEMPGANATAGRASQHRGETHNYAGAVHNKLVSVEGGRVADLLLQENILNSWFATPAAITRMRFFLLETNTANAGGDFAVGSRLTVWVAS